MARMGDDPIAQYGALFERDGARFVPTPLARGPWDERALHGGAASALLALGCETEDPGPAAFVARLTVDLLRPVPLAPLELRTRTTRPGRKVQWLAGALVDTDGREVATAVALRIRSDDVDTSGAAHPVCDAPPGPDDSGTDAFAEVPIAERAVGYWTANDLRIVRGSWTEPGPATAWIRLRCPVVAGVATSPFMRVAAAADFGSGVGNPVRFTHAAAINPEVTIHVHRHPVDEWVCLESTGWTDPHGVGLVETRLHDVRGAFGRAMQALLVEPADKRRPIGSVSTP